MTLGAYKKETAQLILDVVKYLTESGFVIQRPGGGQQFIPPEAPIYVRNDSGIVVPAFACMQVTGTVEAGGQNYITIDQPADAIGSAGGYLFNGFAPIEIGGYGIAHDGPEARMLTNGAAITTGASWRPVVSAWTVEPGGDVFSAVGADDIETDVMRAFVVGASSGGTVLYRFTLNASLASGTADADILLMDGTDTTIDADVLDPLGIFASLISVGASGLCLLQNGSYYVIQANCPV